jgi:hypothetical protein
MALELAKHNPVYEDIASKFFEVPPQVVATLELITFRPLALHLYC